MTAAISGHKAKERFVGVDLQDNEDSRSIIKAIMRDNPDTKVTNFPGLLKVQCHEQLDIRRETVEAELQRPWDTQEFNMNIVTYVGDIQEWDDDHILVRWNTN
ncbi:MAG TPA: MmoB/DmpM family protein [Chloroflexia bacterium]|nr:MmoB/DmpM family protein [Chloroflexia bacterium]